MEPETEILAWRKFPNPNGENYFKKELSDKTRVIELFDFCQILEATIFDVGWKYLFEKYQLKGIIEIDSKSGWTSNDDLGEWITAIFYNALISGYEPLKREFGTYNEQSGIFINSNNESRKIDWKKIYNLKNNILF